MSVNRYRPHVLVVPEDDANRQIANGFILHHSLNVRAMQVLPACGGREKVVQSFHRDHEPTMHALPHRFLVLVVDFDAQSDRFAEIGAAIPPSLQDRVFVLGARTEPEDLRKAKLGSYEQIGKNLADECCNRQFNTWGHELLKNNAPEIGRMSGSVRPVLFDDASVDGF